MPARLGWSVGGPGDYHMYRPTSFRFCAVSRRMSAINQLHRSINRWQPPITRRRNQNDRWRMPTKTTRTILLLPSASQSASPCPRQFGSVSLP